ncbi:putative Exodeoxyribonuclease V beta chain [Vibrio nigripulchritudo SFn27]|uniref:Putative Exodeoxyribonuclease V beta chain n=1 Tax=Vibrio nigripulchritudo TaxID=28173 RepID=U4K5A8_9VIBR|nr:hypothetical protein [Vibrio nigripulchritudo]CCN84546.1 putative Exodeoxyribonuclease V beta chain [Vibrio nigripulchritudo BLFn1]CCN88868.1 putative Exodeoxyribonuclease V beta chain [Vibrio nigripulchritudo SFn27]CCN94356.1 putative Exodeoxyribonuclease V beta chain [Vibrio nigripulchritudo ENn2]CCO40203.1 putative Exodeoxyribonuclease V beta chain [Vibrio nigripulchritudo SFn135]CCO51540.1 putative Exodeoxyribonuclease V beta chain [Vibrio nigripulchritudo Wn13]
MTAETVLTNVLLEIGLDNPSAQLTSHEYEIRQIKTFMNAAGSEIARRAEWYHLVKEQVVSGGVSEAILPDDFQMLTEQNAVRLNKAGFHPVRLTSSPEVWALLSERPSAQPYCHLHAGKILFSPELETEGATVRYVSKHWVEGKAEVTQNGDKLLVPERLIEKGTIWRWKRQKGLPYDDLLAEFEADFVTEIQADRGGEDAH